TSFIDFAEGATDLAPSANAFACYLPIFAGGGVPATAEERDAKLLGCVAALIDVDALFESAARAMRLETMSLRVFVDEGFGAGGRKSFVWKSGDDGLDDDYDRVRAIASVDEHRLVFGSRCFRVLAHPNQEFAVSAVVV